MPPETCPNCGALVPARAACCPECGADEQTGWSDSAQADRLGIPDDNFDYQRFVREEFGGQKKRRELHWLWWLTALLLTGLLLFLFR
jgi:RNA polymerase subunit RPABC4/transcription elongation factor Spt4